MKLPPWVVYTMIGVTAALLLFGVLQVLWIRDKLETISHKAMQVELKARDQAETLADLDNKLTMYSLVVDCRATTAMNASTTNMYTSLAPYIQGRVASVPQVCDGRYVSTKVALNKAGFLVLLNNEGAQRLADDILQNRVQYIVVRNTLLLVQVDNQSNEDQLQAFVESKKINGVSENIASRRVFYVYAIQSDHNRPTELMGKTCVSAVRGFLGNTEGSPDLNNAGRNIELNKVLGYDTVTLELPCHVLGYRV